MRFQSMGDKKEFVAYKVKNDESSASITAGMPVILSVDGTDDGLAVVLPTSSTAAKIAAFQFGVATGTIAAGKIGEALVNGMYDSGIIVCATRAASTDSFASYAAIAVGAVLHPVSVANAFSVVAASTATLVHGAFIAASIASGASSASATSNTGTAVTFSRKVFMRLM